LPELPEVETV